MPIFKIYNIVILKIELKILRECKISSNNRDVVTWRKAKVKMDGGDHWTRDNASPSFVLLCWGLPYICLTKRATELSASSVLLFSAVILSDILIELLPLLLCALDQIRPCATFPGGSHGTQSIFWDWWISENSQDQLFSILISTCWS